MAALTGTAVTGNLKGLREDLSDMIYNVSPTQCPVFERGQKGKADAVFHEWQNDALAAASTTNAQPEGNNFTSFDAVVATTRIGNYCQIFEHTISISGTTEAVKKAGRAREMAYQTLKKMKEIKRDFEANITANIAASGTDPRKLGTLGAFIKTNTDKGVGGADPVYTTVPNATRTDGTQRTITETQLKNVVQLIFTNSADEPTFMVVGPTEKQTVSSFAGIAPMRYDIASGSKKPGTIIAAASVYVHDYGVLEVVPDRFSRSRDAWILNPKMYGIDYLRPLHTEELAKTGDAQNKLLVAELTLRVNNEAAHGLIADLS